MIEYQKEQQIVEWLKEYKACQLGIENLEQMIEDISEADMGINYGKESSVSTNKFSSVVENACLKIDKLNIRHRIKVMQNIVNSVDKALESLTNIEKEVVVNRCAKGKYYYEFCYKIGVSERMARRIKRQALNKMCIVIFGKE